MDWIANEMKTNDRKDKYEVTTPTVEEGKAKGKKNDQKVEREVITSTAEKGNSNDIGGGSNSGIKRDEKPWTRPASTYHSLMTLRTS